MMFVQRARVDSLVACVYLSVFLCLGSTRVRRSRLAHTGASDSQANGDSEADSSGPTPLDMMPVRQGLATIGTLVATMGWQAVDDSDSKVLHQWSRTPRWVL
jgi:hypothetical protein